MNCKPYTENGEKVMTTAEFLDYMNSGKQDTAVGLGLGRSRVVADLFAEQGSADDLHTPCVKVEVLPFKP